MSKKSYKRNQNRLYREIKRRILAEQALPMRPVPVMSIQKEIETIAIRQLVPDYVYTKEMEFVRSELAYQIARKLIAEGYIEYFSKHDPYSEILDVTEIEARLKVVKPHFCDDGEQNMIEGGDAS